MKNVIQADEDIRTSYVYIGHLLLRHLKKKGVDKISIYDAVSVIRKDLKIFHYRQFIFSLLFLHSLGLIDFKEPYIYIL